MDYRKYKLSIREFIYGGGIYISALWILSHLFYDSIIPVVLFSPGIILFYKYMRKLLKQRRDRLLTNQFKDTLNCISSLLSTGFSLENAIIEAKKELLTLHGTSLMYTELDLMSKKLQLNIPVELIISDFASRTDIDAIVTFSQILSIAKPAGGDLRAVILATTKAINSEIDINTEIDTHLAGKKFELYIMSVMPPLIMIYIQLTQPGFFTPVYHNILGVIVMSFCLILYVISIVIAFRILSITR